LHILALLPALPSTPQHSKFEWALLYQLIPAQRHYITMEKELLSLVAILQGHCTTLLGCLELHIHTDHHHLPCSTLTSQWALQ